MLKLKNGSVRKPRILITTKDLEILENILGDGVGRSAGSRLLDEELSRAVVVNNGFNSRPFCRVGSRVTYEDLGTGVLRSVVVVLPGQANIDKGCISVLSPVGAALIGLTPGAVIGWSDESGRPHQLKLVEVENAYDPIIG